MSVSAVVDMNVTVTETLETNVGGLSSTARSVTHNGYNSSRTINSGSAQPATKVASFEKDLSGGAATIDLTSITGTNGATVNLNGLKVQAFKVKAKSANANPITLTEGASNGYELLGASWTIILQPSQEVLVWGHDSTPDVSGTTKTIDMSGTDTQGVEIIVVAG